MATQIRDNCSMDAQIKGSLLHDYESEQSPRVLSIMPVEYFFALE